MYQYDDPTVVAQLPAPAAAGTPGYFTDGNPSQGLPATILRSDYMNMIMMELLNVLTAGGITPSKTTYNQVLAALNAMYYKKGGAIDNSPIGQNTPASVTGTTVTATTGGLKSGPCAFTAPAAGNGLFGAATGFGAFITGQGTSYDVALVNRSGSAALGVVPNTTRITTNGASDTGDGNVLGGTTWHGGLVKYGPGTWSAPAAGNGLAYGHANWGMMLAGYGSAFDVTLANKSSAPALQVPTGTQRVVFNGATDSGDAGVFGGAVQVGTASAAQHAVRYDQTFGLGQTWQSVTGSRAFGTNYTNTTSKPIMVSAWGMASATGSNLTASVGGVSVAMGQHETASADNVCVTFVVPPGATYQIASTGVTITAWSELR